MRAATGAGIGAIALWCFSGVCYAIGGRTVGAMPYLAMASAVGVLTIMAMRAIRGQAVIALFRIPGRVMAAGFLGVALYSVMLGSAMGMAEESELGQVMLLNYLWPIWIVLLGLGVLQTQARAGRAILGALFGFAGLVVAKGVSTFWQAPSSWWPHVLALGGGFFWAMYSVLLRRWNVPAEQGGSTFHFAVCAACAAIIGVLDGGWKAMARMDGWSLGWVLFGGIGPVGLAYYWWEIGVKRGNVHLIALLAYFIPIGSAVLIGLFFREAMSWELLAGAAMIAGGAWLGRWGSADE